jgi:thioredoxin 1
MGKSIIKFESNGCLNCKALGTILETVLPDYADISFSVINSSDKDAVKKYEISSLPTLVFERDGVEVGRLVGLKPKVLITKKIAEVF